MSIVEIGPNEFVDTDGIKIPESDEPVLLTFMLGDKEIPVTYSMMDDKLKEYYDSGLLTQGFINKIYTNGFGVHDG